MQNQIPDQTPGGWLVRIIGAIVSVIVMVGLFFIGITVFAAVAGLALLVFIVLAVRVWWLRRQLQRRAGPGGASARPRRDRTGGVTLEGEYEDRSPRDR